MRKILSLLLVFVMLLCLCACSKNNAQSTDSDISSNPASTENTGEQTNNTSDDEQEDTESSTLTPGKDDEQKDTESSTPIPGKDDEEATKQPISAPDKDKQEDTEEPSTPPTDTDPTQPSDCEHTYTTVSCTVPKMCTKCQHLAGNALPHNYKNGSCTVCGRAEMLVTFQEGDWVARTVKNGTVEQGEVLSEYVLDQDKRHYSSVICFSNATACSVSTGKVIYNNKTYHSDWYFTTFTSCIWEEDDDTITVTLEHTDPIIEFVLTKTSETQLTVISSTNTAYVPVGIVFVKQ